MAEFCLECWNKINGFRESKRKYTISKDLYLCEGCGKWKPVIIMERRAYYTNRFDYYTLPIRAVCNVIYFMFRLILLPYLILKRKKSKNKRN